MKKLWLIAGLALVIAVPGQAATIWVEATNGDLSNSGIAPTAFGLFSQGASTVIGTVGDPDIGDYFTFTISADHEVQSVILDTYVPTGGNTTSIVVFYSGETTDGSYLGERIIGTEHIGTNLLTGTGMLVSPPLTSGSYTVKLGELTSENNAYQMTVNTTRIPEPSTYLLFSLGALGVLVWRRKQRVG